MIPDGQVNFSRLMGMLSVKIKGFGQRSWRYAMVVNDGVIEALFKDDGNDVII